MSVKPHFQGSRFSFQLLALLICFRSIISKNRSTPCRFTSPLFHLVRLNPKNEAPIQSVIPEIDEISNCFRIMAACDRRSAGHQGRGLNNFRIPALPDGLLDFLPPIGQSDRYSRIRVKRSAVSGKKSRNNTSKGSAIHLSSRNG